MVTERIARTLNSSGATQATGLDISKAFDRVWHNGLLHKLRAYGVTDGIFQIISSFLSGWKLKVVLDGKSSPEFAINVGVPQGSILGPTLFFLFINDLPDIALLKIAIYADDTTLYCSCDKASDIWKQVEMSSSLESDLRDTVEWGNRWRVSFNAGKTQLVSFDQSSNSGVIDIKMEKAVLEEKSSFRLLGLSFSSKLVWGFLHYLNCQGCF